MRNVRFMPSRLHLPNHPLKLIHPNPKRRTDSTHDFLLLQKNKKHCPKTSMLRRTSPLDKTVSLPIQFTLVSLNPQLNHMHKKLLNAASMISPMLQKKRFVLQNRLCIVTMFSSPLHRVALEKGNIHSQRHQVVHVVSRTMLRSPRK
jgi:hypothetical protein